MKALQIFKGYIKMNKIPKIPKAIKDLAKRVYPDYKGRKIYLKKWDGQPIDCTSYWYDGSRTYFSFVNYNMDIIRPPDSSPWRQQDENRQANLIKGLCCITHTYFCGHDCGLTVTVHEDDFPKEIEHKV